MQHLQRLRCVVQSYEWGCKGASSSVARLHHAASPSDIQPALPYAELWMGTHPSGPSLVQPPGGAAASPAPWVPLQEHLTATPAALGPAGAYSADSALPFLFKVLSVGKALSVQAHPDRALAARLHAARPDLYKDANHKPEMAIALTPFEALCGFRAPADLCHWLQRTPELRALAGGGASDALAAAAGEAARSGSAAPFEAALRPWYAALMAAPPALVAEQVAALGARLAAQGGAEAADPGPAGAAAAAAALPYTPLPPNALAVRLLQQYPGSDIGVFAPYLLNALRLAPGGALFLGSGEPHAYLAGDCVEVMACSDNVVRAGLTPKFKDVDTLVGMLTYSCSGRPAVSEGVPLPAPAPHTRHYPSPVPEFQVQATALPRGAAARDALPGAAAPSIFIVLAGRGRAVGGEGGSSSSSVAIAAGDVWFVPAGLQLALEQDAEEGAEGLVVHRAMANSA
jgi:mannose-6-phosphate isomerase